jgi:hypothetical protein
MQTVVGRPIRLEVQAADHRVDLFAEFKVAASPTGIYTVLDDVATPGGIYTAEWVPAVIGAFGVVAKLYLDAAREIEAGYEIVSFDVAVVPDPAEAAASQDPGTSPVVIDTPDPVNPWDGPRGIFQSDIILRTALVEGIAQIRASKAETDIILSSLEADERSAKTYGPEIDRIREFIRRLNIPVVAEHTLSGPPVAAVSVATAGEEDAETTLADLHYETSADLPGTGDLAGFTAVLYDPQTGRLVLPAEIADTYQIDASYTVVDDTGMPHRISDVLADDVIVLADRVVAGFTAAKLRLLAAAETVPVESKVTRETYRVGCHAAKPNELIWLHALVKYILHRFKADLLEGRGFERTTTASGPASVDTRFNGQIFWTQYITVTGFARDSWRRDAGGRILLTAVAVTPTPAAISVVAQKLAT